MTAYEELTRKIRETTVKNAPLYTEFWMKRETLSALMRESSYSTLDDERDDVEVLHFENGKTVSYTREGTLYGENEHASWKLVKAGTYEAQRYPIKSKTTAEIL